METHKPKTLFGSISADEVVKQLDHQYKAEDIPQPKRLFDSNTSTMAVSGVYEMKPKSLLSNPTKNPKPTGPKSLLANATIRNRIEVSLEDLRKYNASDAILEKAKQQIAMTNVDELCLKYVLDWGSELQETHSKHLQEMMSLSTVDILGKTKTTIGELVQKMNELDVIGAMKDSWYKSKEKKVAELVTELKNLKTLADTLRADYLLDIHERADIMKDELTQLRGELDPFIITCSFFSEYEKDNFPKELYISRLSSLLATKASIGNDLVTIAVIISTYLVLIETINSIVRNEIPMWISNLTSVLSGNAADLTTIQATKTNIIDKLTKTL